MLLATLVVVEEERDLLSEYLEVMIGTFRKTSSQYLLGPALKKYTDSGCTLSEMANMLPPTSDHAGGGRHYVRVLVKGNPGVLFRRVGCSQWQVWMDENRDSTWWGLRCV
jgi:hypothetical protein